MGAKMKVTTSMLGDKRVGHFVETKTLDTAATVQEAIDAGYVVGKKELVVSAVSGVVRSMVAGISKDANGRKIDEVVSLQPSLKLKNKLADNCEPVTKDNVTANLKCHVLKEGDIDTTDWQYTVEGASSDMNIETVTTGDVIGEVQIGKSIKFNGTELDVPSTATLTWTANDGTQTKTGSIADGDRTCTSTRISTTNDVLNTLTGSTWEGKTIVFTLTNGTKVAIKAATLRLAE